MALFLFGTEGTLKFEQSSLSNFMTWKAEQTSTSESGACFMPKQTTQEMARPKFDTNL